MKSGLFTTLGAMVVVAILLTTTAAWEPPAAPPAQSSPGATPAASESLTLTEARGRARLLHETLHGALQVVHRDFFDEEESRTIPSRSLEDVFSELKKTHNVTLRWLAVNALPLNIDHNPIGDFEKQAVKALGDGEKEYERLQDGTYQFAGSIRLASQCLKCHAPMRTDTKDRIAGLVISMPLASTQSE